MPEPTRHPRYGNRLYCLVWVDHDLFKVGLGSGRNARDRAAVGSLTKYLAHEHALPGAFSEWRAELPALDGAAWGDCQRLEMVFGTVVKRLVHASAASAVGLEWFSRQHLELISWETVLSDAAAEALRVSGMDETVEWVQYTSRPASDARPDGGEAPHAQQQRGRSQRDAHRTRRNKAGRCALKDCPKVLAADAVQRDRFFYCSDRHAKADDGDDRLYLAELGSHAPRSDRQRRPPASAAGNRSGRGESQRDSHRTRRNKHGRCALKDCGRPVLGDRAARRGRFLYCSASHAQTDAPTG